MLELNRSLRLCLVLCASSSAFAQEPSAKAFEQLRSLVGSWSSPTKSGKEFRVNFRLISSDSALVETYTTASGKETMTVFHLDGAQLLATHYCAQGNQPRLRLTGSSATKLNFEFVDSTNLKTPESSHLHKLELQLTDPGHFVEVETYREAGKDEPETLAFTRVSAAAK